MILEIGKCYKICREAFWTVSVYHKITGHPLKRDTLITLVSVDQKKDRNGDKTIMLWFFNDNNLYWHGFIDPSEHATNIKEFKIFEEII